MTADYPWVPPCTSDFMPDLHSRRRNTSRSVGKRSLGNDMIVYNGRRARWSLAFTCTSQKVFQFIADLAVISAHLGMDPVVRWPQLGGQFNDNSRKRDMTTIWSACKRRRNRLQFGQAPAESCPVRQASFHGLQYMPDKMTSRRHCRGWKLCFPVCLSVFMVSGFQSFWGSAPCRILLRIPSHFNTQCANKPEVQWFRFIIKIRECKSECSSESESADLSVRPVLLWNIPPLTFWDQDVSREPQKIVSDFSWEKYGDGNNRGLLVLWGARTWGTCKMRPQIKLSVALKSCLSAFAKHHCPKPIAILANLRTQLWLFGATH